MSEAFLVPSRLDREELRIKFRRLLSDWLDIILSPHRKPSQRWETYIQNKNMFWYSLTVDQQCEIERKLHEVHIQIRMTEEARIALQKQFTKGATSEPVHTLETRGSSAA